MLARAASNRLVLPLICLTAFLLRVVTAWLAPDHFWSYTAYYVEANTLVHGGGYCMEPGKLCAFFPPVFPTVVAAAILGGNVKAGVILLCSLAGAGTVWMTSKIGSLLFSPAVGLLAAGYAAIYPYYLWHDSVLQENAVLAFVVALTIWMLLRAMKSDSKSLWIGAGAMIAMTVLTKANLTLFVPLAILWVGRRRALWVALGVMLLLGPWLVRTWRITGAPIIYSNGGFSLWTSNHRLTFDYFPQQSIDAAQEPEWLEVPLADRQAFDALKDPHFIQQTQWYWRRGMEFIRVNPGLTAKRAIYKVWIAFSPIFSPAHSLVFEGVYLASYLPLFILAPIGMWRSRNQLRIQGCIYCLIASFIVGCAVFWGHTSHRMYLEPYLMIFAASRLVPGSSEHQLHTANNSA